MLTGTVVKLFSLLYIASLCLATSVKMRTESGGVVWWEGKYSGGSDVEEMKAAVKQAYEDMLADPKITRRKKPGNTMGLIWTKDGGMFQSSVRGVKPSGYQITEKCSDNQHRYQGNCAEVWALSGAEARGWDLNGALIAVYGRLLTGEAGFKSPCEDNEGGQQGCASVLSSEKYGSLQVQCVTATGMTKRHQLLTNEMLKRHQLLTNEMLKRHQLLTARNETEPGWDGAGPESEAELDKRAVAKKKKAGSKSTGSKSTGSKSTGSSSTAGKSCSAKTRGVAQLLSAKKGAKSINNTGSKAGKKSGKKAGGAKKTGSKAGKKKAGKKKAGKNSGTKKSA